MKISEILKAKKPVFSFEFFPPRDMEGERILRDVIRNLKELEPDFVSVTYGAGGSTRAQTLELVGWIKRFAGLEAMAHLTCVGHSREEVRRIVDELDERGIDNILALRGDPPRGEKTFHPHPNGFRYANELTAAIASRGRFCIGVAGYPEKHPEAPSLAADLEHLRQKVDSGASFVITQLFFDNNYYFEFVNKARASGITCPIIPGIMPITNYAQVQRFVSLCGATFPPSLRRALEPVQEDPQAVARLGLTHAVGQCRELLLRGAPGIHFYTLNKSRATREILQSLRADKGGWAPGHSLRDI